MSATPRVALRAAPARGTPSAALPRYASVADALVRDIAAGRYAIGSLLPPESALCLRYGVSRHTVREATRKLVGLGLITRHPGIGTIVRAQSAQVRYTASIGSPAELIQYAQRTRLKLLATDEVIARGALAAELGCREGERWVCLHTLRYAAGVSPPISVTDIYVPPAYRDLAQHFGHGRVAVYELIEREHGVRIQEVRQDIGGVAMPPEAAALLGVTPGSPGLEVTRTYVGARRRTVSISKNLYPAGRFRMSTAWRLQES